MATVMYIGQVNGRKPAANHEYTKATRAAVRYTIQSITPYVSLARNSNRADRAPISYNDLGWQSLSPRAAKFTTADLKDLEA
jgi:hypothetical protein